MNRKMYLVKALLLASLGLTALPAGATGAVFFAGQFNAQRLNTFGTTTVVLPPNANHFCYLSRVGVVETDTGGERTECRVRPSATVWLLEAFVGASSDADVFCSAICYRH
jgi:hypothetical protein